MRREKILSVSMVIVSLLLLAISLPIPSKIARNDHIMTVGKGNILNQNRLYFTLNPNIEGIKGVKIQNKIKVEIPFFVDQRFLTEKYYIPFWGDINKSYLLKAEDKYTYSIAPPKKESNIVFHLLNLILISITLLFVILLYKRIRINSISTIILTMTPILLFFKSSIFDILSILTLILLIKLKFKKVFKVTIFIFIVVIILFLYESNHKNFDYSVIANNKVALEALDIIKSDKTVTEAINYTEKSYTKNEKLDLSGCHASLHELGLLSYLKLGSSIKALKYASTKCEYGYLHGVEDAISLLTTGVLKSQKNYQDGCLAIYNGKNDNTYSECVHGSGHAFYDLHDGDLNKAYLDCQIWKIMREYCEGAVSMSMGEYHLYKRDNAYVPEICLKVNIKSAKISCILLAYRYAITNNNLEEDIIKGGVFCDKLSTDLKNICYSSIGTAVAYILKNQMDKENKAWPSKYCTFNGVVENYCYFAYISNMAYYHALNKQPVSSDYYCLGSPIEYRACSKELTRQANRIKN